MKQPVAHQIVKCAAIKIPPIAAGSRPSKDHPGAARRVRPQEQAIAGTRDEVHIHHLAEQ